jgi:hypothetical protein
MLGRMEGILIHSFLSRGFIIVFAWAVMPTPASFAQPYPVPDLGAALASPPIAPGGTRLYAAPNACGSDDVAIAEVPSGKSALIMATRTRDEASHYWVLYNRDDGKGWLEDGPPFGPIDPWHGPFEYRVRSPGALDPVPSPKKLLIKIIARWDWGSAKEQCMPYQVINSAGAVTFYFYTGNSEPENLTVSITQRK